MSTQKMFSDVCRDLYRGAQTRPITEFPAFAINVLSKIIDFDTAMFGLMSKCPDGKVLPHYGHVHNEDFVASDEWLAISTRDPILNGILGNLGQSLSCHTPEQFRAPEDAQILDYTLRRRHINVLSMALSYGPNSVVSAISLRRGDSKWTYNRRDKLALEILLPHVCESFRINRATFAQRVVLSTPEPLGGVCIFSTGRAVVCPDLITSYTQIGGNHLGNKSDEIKTKSLRRKLQAASR